MNHIRYEVFFKGRVQGVGFRYTSAQVARRFKVTGWVKNLPDSSVQMVVEADAGELDSYVDAVVAETHGRVTDQQTHRKRATGEFSGFEIRH
jgi:acylphosphatase